MTARQPRQTWTESDVQKMIRLREIDKMIWAEIDRELGRKAGSSCGKYDSLRRIRTREKMQVSKRGGGGRVDISEAEQQRAARRTLQHDSLTGAFFGDPLPGRSALDQKRGAS